MLGGHGGAGATCLVAVLAAVAALDGDTPVIVDLDPLGGGIDVTLAAEDVAGVRWSALHAAGGRLDPRHLAEALPRWGQVAFLACDRPDPPDDAAVRSVLDAARALGPVVVDVGRPGHRAALAACSVVVLVVRGDVRAVAAAAALRRRLASDGGLDERCRLVVRSDAAVVPARTVAGVLDLPLIGRLAADPGLRCGRDRGVDPRLLRRDTRAVARRVLASAATPGRLPAPDGVPR